MGSFWIRDFIQTKDASEFTIAKHRQSIDLVHNHVELDTTKITINDKFEFYITKLYAP